MTPTQFNTELLAFLNASPTPFHAVATLAKTLTAAGFKALPNQQAWQLQPGGRYYTLRNDSSIVAFVLGTTSLQDTGIRMVGAHTDSPCLRVKPNPERSKQGLWQLGVEPYGGILMNPWFDRDLSLAGRVSFVDDQQQLQSCLIDFQLPIAIIPSLAIHLDREANEGRKINAQLHLPPVLAQLTGSEQRSFNELVAQQIATQHPQLKVATVLAHELSFYDTQPARLIGLQEDFIAGARLDNLLSCFVGLQALLQADASVSSLLVCNDHEEVGSQSTSGASGPFLKDVLVRISSDAEQLQKIIDRSLLISADNAHAVHPNYSDKHDENHGPLLNAGPVIKINANQRYATNSNTHALFKWLAEKAKVPVQTFVTRSDLACGSTIGPITATALGVDTIDVGMPTFAMHSIRELAGSRDPWLLYQVLLQFHALHQLKN